MGVISQRTPEALVFRHHTMLFTTPMGYILEESPGELG